MTITSITKTIENDRIEIVSRWNIQVRSATIIKEDGVELSRTFERHVLTPGRLDKNNELLETDISEEDADVQAICNVVWTDKLKLEYQAYLIATKSEDR